MFTLVDIDIFTENQFYEIINRKVDPETAIQFRATYAGGCSLAIA